MKNRFTVGLVLVTAVLLSVDTAEAGRTKATRCPRDTSAKPVVIKSLVAESSRRIHVISEPGIMQDWPYPAEGIAVTDDAGFTKHFPGSIGFPNLTDAYVEGLLPGKTYSIRTYNSTVCMLPSVAQTITMPADVADATPPVASGLRSVLAGFVAYSRFIDFIAEDNVAVKGFRVYADGVLISDKYTENTGMRAWTNAPGKYVIENGAHLMMRVPDAFAGKLADVIVEVEDYFGNVKTIQARLQL